MIWSGYHPGLGRDKSVCSYRLTRLIPDTGIKMVSAHCFMLRELSISDCPRVTDTSLLELARLGPRLRYLSAAKCGLVTDRGVTAVARHCYKLRYLNLRGCEAVSDAALEMIARSCSRLRSLDIGKCDVTDAGLQVLASRLPSLRGCEMISDKGMEAVASHWPGSVISSEETGATLVVGAGLVAVARDRGPVRKYL